MPRRRPGKRSLWQEPEHYGTCVHRVHQPSAGHLIWRRFVRRPHRAKRDGDSGYEDELVLSVGSHVAIGARPRLHDGLAHAERRPGPDRRVGPDLSQRRGPDDLEQPLLSGRADRRGRLLRSATRNRSRPAMAPTTPSFSLPTILRIPSGASTRSRAKQHPEFTLNLLVQRIGKLAPEPGGLGRLDHPRFRSAGTELDGVNAPVRLFAAGTYADFGREIL